MATIKSSTRDYLYALEGTSYARTVIMRERDELMNIMNELKNPATMDGDTAKEYVTRLTSACGVIDAVVERFDAFANMIQEVCAKNNVQIGSDMMDNFDNAMKALNTKAEQVKAFKGKRQ